MEKLVNHCDMELMKMAMLKHEETFRQQVHELHRLYRVQRQLMTGLTGPSCRRQRRKKPRRALDLHLPADEYVAIGEDNATREDELELTLAVGGGRASRRKRRDEGTLLASDCSGGGSPTSSLSTDNSGSPTYQRADRRRCLQEGTVMKQQQSPWLVQCLSLRMA
ncbi:uncharacterized protein LOC133929716 [Phragmites australis]|uniref:uncharacterized protein LOC133929716 n=1 Tax=Phragmites australis TaxID=29695 RepID=UPI002D7A01CF|nr:uncharacterized protein LOC133929716 [Phragmites australis]